VRELARTQSQRAHAHFAEADPPRWRGLSSGPANRRARRAIRSLALVTNLVMAWNTHQMQATLDRSRAQGRQIDPQVLHHITPMGLEDINFGSILVFPLERYRSRLLPSSPPPTTMVA